MVARAVRKLNRLAKNWLRLFSLVLAIIIVLVPLAETLGKDIPPKDPLVERIEQAEGKPVIVHTVKYGDDKKPTYARTYCQLLPFKRGIGDDGIYCWVETLK